KAGRWDSRRIAYFDAWMEELVAYLRPYLLANHALNILYECKDRLEGIANVSRRQFQLFTNCHRTLAQGRRAVTSLFVRQQKFRNALSMSPKISNGPPFRYLEPSICRDSSRTYSRSSFINSANIGGVTD